jgi:hypothetical protein
MMAQPIMKSCFEQLSSTEWENHLKSWKRGGLSKAEYCGRKHISYYAFNYWKKRHKKPKPPSSLTLIKLEDTQKITSSFQKPPVTSQSPIRFWVKDFCIEVDNYFSPAVISQLVQTLRRM